MKKIKRKPSFAVTLPWLLRRPACFVAFGCGAGLAPKAPGTFGTLLAFPPAWAWLALTDFPPLSLALWSLALFPLGVWLCERAERALGVSDYGGIVFDEIAAMLGILAFVPVDWLWQAAAFVLFRLLDATKPFPVSWFDAEFHGGFGIMLDDYVAGAGAAAILLAAQCFF